jgi:hypothetical protein
MMRSVVPVYSIALPKHTTLRLHYSTVVKKDHRISTSSFRRPHEKIRKKLCAKNMSDNKVE